MSDPNADTDAPNNYNLIGTCVLQGFHLSAYRLLHDPNETVVEVDEEVSGILAGLFRKFVGWANKKAGKQVVDSISIEEIRVRYQPGGAVAFLPGTDLEIMFDLGSEQK